VNLLAQMASFVRIVDLGSLSAAARAQKLSLPAISRQLGELERELGVPLVLRSTRRLSVTTNGQLWYEHCVRILRELDEARQSVACTGVRGPLVVSAGVTIGSRLILPRLPDLHRAHPELVVELRLEDSLVDLLAEGVDVAVRGGVRPPDSSAIVAVPVLAFERVVVASRAYLKKHKAPADPARLASHDALLQVTSGAPVGTWRLRRGDEEPQPVAVRGPFRSTAPLALREAAIAGMGVALLPEWLVRDDLAEGRLQRVLPAWRSDPVTVWGMYRVEQRRSPRIQAFLAAVTRA
jgi:DNA-binding transcriptional LysR family regulator